ncbi:hypothetical protein GCM10027346_38790 [Hymenobacter seoulensis]
MNEKAHGAQDERVLGVVKSAVDAEGPGGVGQARVQDYPQQHENSPQAVQGEKTFLGKHRVFEATSKLNHKGKNLLCFSNPGQPRGPQTVAAR